MKRLLCRSALVPVFVSALTLLLPGFVFAAEKIRINGSGSALDMVKPLVAAYIKAHPEVTVEIDKPLGSSGAVKALLAGALDIVVSSKKLKADEINSGLKSQEYGRTPLAIVVNKSVTKKNITTAELEAIYSGKTATWPDGDQVRLVLRPESDIDSAIIRTLSPAMDMAFQSALTRPGMMNAVTDPESNELVIRTRGAVGASGLTGVLASKGQLMMLSLNGVKPTVAALAEGSYPLAKDIRFVTSDNTSAEARKLLDFIYSAKGRALATKAGVQVMAGAKDSR